MLKRLPGWYWTILLSMMALGVGLLAPTWFSNLTDDTSTESDVIIIAQQATETSTLLPVTPLSTNTQRPTLRPAPTLEPPTPTRLPSQTPLPTATNNVIANVTVEGILGFPSPTVDGVDECEVREDWQLTVEVQVNETLTMIANRFNTTSFALAEANCLEDSNLIRVGQRLRVPGDSLPVAPEFECVEYVMLQPLDQAFDVPGSGQIVFNWQGPRAPRYLLRLFPPDFDFNNPDPRKWLDYTFDRRQNHAIDAMDIPAAGQWHWQVVPLDLGFRQICPESPIHTFYKLPAPTPTPTITPFPTLPAGSP